MTGDVFVNATNGGLLAVQMSVDGTTYTAQCTINTSRSLDSTAKASSTELADCTNPTAPAQIARLVQSLDSKITGAGVADGPSVYQIWQWHRAGNPIYAKINTGGTGANGGFTVTGQYLITAFNLSGNRGEYQTFTCTLEQAGVITTTANT